MNFTTKSSSVPDNKGTTEDDKPASPVLTPAIPGLSSKSVSPLVSNINNQYNPVTFDWQLNTCKTRSLQEPYWAVYTWACK